MRCLFYVLVDWWSHTGSDSTAFDGRHDLLWCRHDRCGETLRELPANISCQKTSARFSEDSGSTSRTHMSFFSRTIHPQCTIHQLRIPMKKAWRHNAPTPARHYDVILRSCTITYAKNPGKFRLTCWGWRSPAHSDLKIYIDSLHLKL